MRLFFLLLLSLCHFHLCAYTYNEQERSVPCQSYLFQEGSPPNDALIHLLYLLEIPCSNHSKTIVDITQKTWLQRGKERWEFDSKEEEKREALLPLFKQIGMTDGSHAELFEYDYALVHGGFYTRVQKRIRYLVQEFERGVRFKTVVLLTGQRFLDPNTSECALPFKTETEMMLHVWKNFEMPNEMRDLPLVLVDAPRKLMPNGQIQRPGTKETFLEWLKSNPTPGRCLCISSQPFCGYQDSVARTYLPSTFSIETIGQEADSNVAISIYLDNLARWLYQEENRREMNNGIPP